MRKSNTINQRESAEYRAWRLSVFQRDEYKCLLCGSGKNLNAHHIERYADNISKRCLLSNGATVCKSCHRKYHNGWKSLFPYEITSILIIKVKGNYASHYLTKVKLIEQLEKQEEIYEDYWDWNRRHEKFLEKIDSNIDFMRACNDESKHRGLLIKRWFNNYS